jgi:hypothetical protein
MSVSCVLLVIKLSFLTWLFSLGTLSSSTTKTGRHDIAEILMKVALSTINQSINQQPGNVKVLKECIKQSTINLLSFDVK